MKQIKTRLLLIPAIFALSACSFMPTPKNRNDEEVVYPFAVNVEDVKIASMVTTDVMDGQTGEIAYEYYFTLKKSDSDPALYLKAIVYPENTSYKDVRIYKIDENAPFDVITHEEDSTLIDNTFIIRPSRSLAQGEMLLAKFNVETTNPGTRYYARCCVAFYRNAYN